MCGGADGLSSANKSWNLCGFIRRGIPRHVFEQSVCQKRTNFCSVGTRGPKKILKPRYDFTKFLHGFVPGIKNIKSHENDITSEINISSHFFCI